MKEITETLIYKDWNELASGEKRIVMNYLSKNETFINMMDYYALNKLNRAIYNELNRMDGGFQVKDFVIGDKGLIGWSSFYYDGRESIVVDNDLTLYVDCIYDVEDHIDTIYMEDLVFDYSGRISYDDFEKFETSDLYIDVTKELLQNIRRKYAAFLKKAYAIYTEYVSDSDYTNVKSIENFVKYGIGPIYFVFDVSENFLKYTRADY